MIIWPWRLLIPSDMKTRLSAQVQAGSPSLSGLTQSARTDGGGFWMSDLTGITLYTPELVLCARAWAAMLDGGATEFVLPLWDLAQAPRPYVGGGRRMLPGRPAPSTDYFNQDPSFGQPMMVAQVSGAQPLRSTTLGIRMVMGSQLRGGEHFSINDPTLGWRLYRVGQITGTAYGIQTCSIRPPLRAPVTNGQTLEFDVPRYQAKIVPGKSDDLEPTLKQGRWGTVALYAMESLTSSSTGANS